MQVVPACESTLHSTSLEITSQFPQPTRLRVAFLLPQVAAVWWSKQITHFPLQLELTAFIVLLTVAGLGNKDPVINLEHRSQ